MCKRSIPFWPRWHLIEWQWLFFLKLFHLVSFTGFIPMHGKSIRYPFDRHICLYKAICHHPPFSNVCFQRRDCVCYFQWAEQNKSFHQSLVISLWFGERHVSCEHCSSSQKTNCCQLLCCISLGYFVYLSEDEKNILQFWVTTFCVYTLFCYSLFYSLSFSKLKKPKEVRMNSQIIWFSRMPTFSKKKSFPWSTFLNGYCGVGTYWGCGK